jgi:hypothetical protein
MISSGDRWLSTVLTATLVGFAASLVGCASAGPLTPVAVDDVKSVAGTWKGMVYRSGLEPDYVTLTIQEDGSYDLVDRRTIGASLGKGTIVTSQGRLIMQGEKGRGVGTLLSSPGGGRVMNVEATLSDHSTLSAELSPGR